MTLDILLIGNIKRLLKEKGLKQYAVAERANIPPKHLSAMLSGRKNFLSIHIPPIAQALGVSVGELFRQDE